MDEWNPATGRRVSVWPHTLGDFEHFTDCVANVRDGALYVWRSDASGRQLPGLPPVKVYAPGYWATFEHEGEYAPIRVSDLTKAEGYDTHNPSHFTARYGGNLQTQQLPKYRDPMQDLDPDALEQTNGDVTPSAGTGAIVPYPKTEGGADGPNQPGEARETATEGARAGVVERAPKAAAGDPPDTDELESTEDGAVRALVEFYLGNWAAGVRRQLKRAARRRSSSPQLMSTGGSLQAVSPFAWLALLGLPLLLALATSIR